MLEVVTRRDHGTGGWRGRIHVQQAEVRNDLTDGDWTGDTTARTASGVATTAKAAGSPACTAQTACAGHPRATAASKAATAGVATEPAAAAARLRAARRSDPSAPTTRRQRTNDLSVTACQQEEGEADLGAQHNLDLERLARRRQGSAQ